MGFKESFRSFGGKIKDLFSPYQIREQIRQGRIAAERRERLAMEKRIQYGLSYLYVFSEATRAGLARNLGLIVRTSNLKPTSYEHLNQLRRQAEDTVEESRLNKLEYAKSNLLSYIEDPNKKLEIETNALLAARNFWEQALQEQDKAYDIIALGKRRIEEISTRIQQLTKPPNS